MIIKNVLITTVPFGKTNDAPLRLLKDAGFNFTINPYNRKLLPEELEELIKEFDAVIAGTEIITERAIFNASKLRLISRVGVGLDGINLKAAYAKKIKVCYTPHAPTDAVADLTVGLIYSLSRGIHISNNEMHLRNWQRHFGRRVPNLTIGVIGYGRIGEMVVDTLLAIGCKNILINDTDSSKCNHKDSRVRFVDKNCIFSESDVVTLHVPLTSETIDMVSINELKLMKNGSFLINTSRGGIVNEQDLMIGLKSRLIAGAAIDVYEEEPYIGPFSDIRECLLTAHMGSMTFDCRERMEIEATEEVLRYFRNEKLLSEIPEYEYKNQGLKI
jgi:D-3-phosphoglycerate dehydrogenase